MMQPGRVTYSLVMLAGVFACAPFEGLRVSPGIATATNFFTECLDKVSVGPSDADRHLQIT